MPNIPWLTNANKKQIRERDRLKFLANLLNIIQKITGLHTKPPEII